MLTRIRNNVNEIPTRHMIGVLLGKTLAPIVIPITYAVKAHPNLPDQAKSYFAEAAWCALLRRRGYGGPRRPGRVAGHHAGLGGAGDRG